MSDPSQNMSTHADAVANMAGDGSSGEFKPRVAPGEPMMSSGHQPGKLVGNDAIPEFQAEVLPAGSAPSNRTFQPNPVDEVSVQAGANLRSEQATSAEMIPPAQATIPGADSSDVHQGLGHPGAGQSSTEMRHDGQAGRKNPGASLQGVGASTREFKTVDERDPQFKEHRAIDVEERELGRGEIPSAEEREPVQAENLAAERSQRERMDRGN